MNLHSKLLEREAAGKPVTVGVIGAGKFGTMFLSQARLTRGLHVAGVADLDVARARAQLKTAGWPDQSYAAASLADAHKKRATFVTDDAMALIADPRIEVIVEATGVPGAGIAHALSCNRRRQTHRHGQCRSRRGRRPLAGARAPRRRAWSIRSPGATSRR